MSQYSRNNPDEPIRHDWFAGAIRTTGLPVVSESNEMKSNRMKKGAKKGSKKGSCK
jgi:hypothetical protein